MKIIPIVFKILHEGAKPFMCSFCGRQFAIKSNLKKHLRMHERKRIEEMVNIITAVI